MCLQPKHQQTGDNKQSNSGAGLNFVPRLLLLTHKNLGTYPGSRKLEHEISSFLTSSIQATMREKQKHKQPKKHAKTHIHTCLFFVSNKLHSVPHVKVRCAALLTGHALSNCVAEFPSRNSTLRRSCLWLEITRCNCSKQVKGSD